ncbi:MAG TPA: hypothetical protein DCS93_00345 [Microscillaceae bacterium]|nr:hypothetical protein [Microscillaceae bacterium]
MNKLQIIIITSICLSISGLSACKPTSKKGAWIPEDKQMFLKYCKEARKSKDIQLSKPQIDAVCDCALQKSIKAYESFYEANADTVNFKSVGGDCIEQIRGR